MSNGSCTACVCDSCVSYRIALHGALATVSAHLGGSLDKSIARLIQFTPVFPTKPTVQMKDGAPFVTTHTPDIKPAG